MIVITVTLAVLLLWVVAFFEPQSHKLGGIRSKVQQAQLEQAQLQAQLARLRAYSHNASALQALQQRLNAALPPTSDIYDYVTAISNAASATGVKVQSLSPGAGSSSGGVTIIPVTVTTTGTYDQMLSFIKALYALPRLTIISSIGITGGGTGTNRATALDENFSLEILTTGAPTNGTTSAPTTGTG